LQEEKWAFGRLRWEWENDIKTDIGKISCKYVK
jgi:hypothetical protein